MKRVFTVPLYLIIVCVTMGCQSNVDKANKLIKDYMFKHLNDYKSYEVVETTIDTLYNYPETDTACIRRALEASKLMKEANDYEKTSWQHELRMKEYQGKWYFESLFMDA